MRSSRTVPAAVSTALRAAASQDSSLTPMTSVTRYTLMSCSSSLRVRSVVGARQPVKCFLMAFVDVRGQSARGEMARQLEPHERTGGVAGDTFVVTFRKAADGRRVCVGEVRREVKVVVVD